MQTLIKPLAAAAAGVQTLDIISVNFWNILVSLLNLVVLFLLVKHFLFKPVRRVFAERQAAIDHQYAAAKEAEDTAIAHREAWQEKLKSADAQADAIINDATTVAKHRAGQIVEEATERADSIVREAKSEAELERKKAQEGIRREIVDTATSLAEKMLEREVNAEDHRGLIDAFIGQVGESDEAAR